MAAVSIAEFVVMLTEHGLPVFELNKAFTPVTIFQFDHSSRKGS